MLRKDNKKFVCKIYRCIRFKDASVYDESLVDVRFADTSVYDDVSLMEAHKYFCRVVRDHFRPSGRYRVTTSATRCNSVLSSYISL